MANLTASFAPSKTINEAKIENSHGAQVAFNSNGSCVHHPDILLRQKTFTGWKILEKECPRCKIEWEDSRSAHMNHHLGDGKHNTNNPPPNVYSQHNRPAAPFHYPQPPQQQQQQQHPAGVQPQYPSFTHLPQYGGGMPPQPPPHRPYSSGPPPLANAAESIPLPPSPVVSVPFAKIVGVRHHVGTPFANPPHQRSNSQPSSGMPPRMESSSLRHSDPTNSSFTTMSSMASSLPALAQENPKDAMRKLNAAYKSDDVKGILTIMRNHPGSASIQGVGCKALWRIGHRYGNAEAVLSHGGQAIVKDAVSRHAQAEDDIAGHGSMLLKMLEQILSPDRRNGTAGHTPVPLSSLPPVDWRVEKIAVEDIQYLAMHNSMNKLLALMSWYPRSAVIQGTGCKELFGLVNQSPEGSVILEERDQCTIKDAVYHFSSIDNDVADYGPMLLTICSSSSGMDGFAESEHSSSSSSSRNRPPLSSLPTVDHLVERITLRSIDEERDVSRVLAWMQKYQASAMIQGQGCKRLWILLCQDGSNKYTVASHDGKDLIKDALFYHRREIYVVDFGTMILDLIQS